MWAHLSYEWDDSQCCIMNSEDRCIRLDSALEIHMMGIGDVARLWWFVAIVSQVRFALDC